MASNSASETWWRRLLSAIKGALGQGEVAAPEFEEPVPSTMIPVGGAERRSHVRVPVELRVAVRFDTIDDVLNSHTVDVSAMGVFIKTTAPRSVGTRVRIQMTVGEETVDLTGVVVRRVSAAEAAGGPPGMGVNFQDLDHPAESMVARIVERI